MAILTFQYQNRLTEIVIEQGCLNNLNHFLTYQKLVIITDELVNSLYGYLWPNEIIITVPQGEKAKTIDVFNEVCLKLSQLDIDKKTALVAFGGGSIGDLTGFVASTYKRGLPFIQVPTTLLAQVDASIGGKNALNLNDIKNQIGTIYQPNQILVDSSLLSTLDKREFNNGMAEIIKYAILFDEVMFKQIENNTFNLDELIKRSIEYKSMITTKDEQDFNERAVLNFGHTFGHILEQLSSFKLKHGEAIAWGMLYETTDPFLHNRLKAVFSNYGLLKSHLFEPKDLISYLKQDKKNLNNQLLMVDLKAIGLYQLKKKSINEISKEVTREHFW